jgi:hypothetical protein
VAALAIEYETPHKLMLGHIYEGLGEMELDKVVEVHVLARYRILRGQYMQGGSLQYSRFGTITTIQ